MKYLIRFLFFFVFVSNLILAQTLKTKKFERIINKNLPIFTFIITDISSDSLNNYERLFKVDIYNSKKNKLLQTFQHHTSIGNDYFLGIGFLGNGFGHETDSNLIDLNFDGYNDLIFINGFGDMGRNFNYTPYFFSKKENKFLINEKLTEIINPDINKKNKTISEHLCEGCLGDCFTIRTYKIKHNIPVPIKEEVQYSVDGDINNIVNDTYHFKNGKRIKVKSHKFQFK